MAIKATFFPGQDTVTTDKKPHQWDYGQQLEIESADFYAGLTVEVHFGCHGMDEAEVRNCSTSTGVAVVDIPDKCLEQPSTITAWVFEINGARGTTTKTITIPVIARKKPQGSCELPQGFSDKYTQLITEVNDAVKTLTDGDVTAKYAIEAGHAAAANTAGTASTANYATAAGNSETANTAVSLNQRKQQVFSGLYNSGDTVPVFLANGRTYLIEINRIGLCDSCTFLLSVGEGLLGSMSSLSFYRKLSTTEMSKIDALPMYLLYQGNKLSICVLTQDGDVFEWSNDVTIFCSEIYGGNSSVTEAEATLDDLATGGKFKFVFSPNTVGSVDASVWTESADGGIIQDILTVRETGLTEDYVMTVAVNAFSEGETLNHEIFCGYKVYRVV